MAAKRLREASATARGEALRNLLNLPNEALEALEYRELRDDMEHFDERLDAWVARTGPKDFYDSNVGPRRMLDGVRDEDVFRWLDPDTTEFIILGHAYSLGELVSALHTVVIAVDAAKERIEAARRQAASEASSS